VATWRGALKEGNSVPTYVRESYLETVEMGTYQRQELKRRWVRIGTVCLDCQAFVFGLDRLPSLLPEVYRPDPAGIPKQLASSDGIPVRSS